MINENNYTEYFLLYIDKELTAAEQQAVEAFVAAHPAYAAELKQLCEATLDAGETLSFGSKTELLKTEGEEIGIENYEDYFLRYTDRELSADERAATERFVLQHPHLQAAFVALQQTVLTPEAIEFKHKNRLYRQEGKIRVLPRFLAPFSLAASLLLAVALVWQWKPANTESPKPMAATLQQTETAASSPAPARVDSSNETVAETVQLAALPQADPQPQPRKSEIKAAVEKAETSSASTHENKGTKAGEQFARLLPVHLPAAAAQLPPPAADEEIESQRPPTAKTASLKLLEEVSSDDEESLLSVYASQKAAAAQPAVYKELATDDDVADQTLYVGSLQLNKAKVNGFLKSAAHVLGGRPRQENNK